MLGVSVLLTVLASGCAAPTSSSSSPATYTAESENYSARLVTWEDSDFFNLTVNTSEELRSDPSELDENQISMYRALIKVECDLSATDFKNPSFMNMTESLRDKGINLTGEDKLPSEVLNSKDLRKLTLQVTDEGQKISECIYNRETGSESKKFFIGEDNQETGN